MDNTNSDPLPSELTCNDVGSSGFEDCPMIESDDCHRGDAYHDQYYLKLFRLALMECNRCAQERLQCHFSEVVLDWMRCHPSRDLICGLHSEEYYVSETFKRFWQAPLRSQTFELNALSDALRYLRARLNGVILDALRDSLRPKEALSQESVSAEKSHVNNNRDSYEVWKIVQGMFSDVREQRLAYLLFHCGLKPLEIVRYCPQEFSDVGEVSRMRQNIMDLLRDSDQVYCS